MTGDLAHELCKNWASRFKGLRRVDPVLPQPTKDSNYGPSAILGVSSQPPWSNVLPGLVDCVPDNGTGPIKDKNCGESTDHIHRNLSGF
jgi:hypothetical protein